jgi:acetyl-CoA synthetase
MHASLQLEIDFVYASVQNGPRRIFGMTSPDIQLAKNPLIPLPAHWQRVERADQLARCRAMSIDEYWAWVAKQQRWFTEPTVVREGGLGEAKFFPDGRINIADNCVDRWAENPETAERTALIWEGEPGDVRSYTYTQLRDEVSALAAAMVDMGVGHGDVVAIYMPNLIEAFTAIHACNRIGAIYTVLFSGFGPEAVSSRLQAAGATTVVVADASFRRGKQVPLLATLREARKTCPSVARTIVVDRTGTLGELQDGEHRYDDVVAAGKGGIDCTPLDPNEASFLIFTSGTTAKPKGVVHSVGGFLLGTWANAHWQVGYEDGDVYWCAADVGWLTFPIQAVVGGLACGMTLLCYEGALDTPTTDRFYEICRRHHVTKVLGAPTLARMLRKFGGTGAEGLELKLFTMQGEPLDPETFHWTSQTFDVPVVNAYGQTETGSTWCYPVYGVDDLKAGSLGRVVPGHDFDIVDDEGKSVPVGTKGNLVLTEPFPTMCRTVWQDPARYHEAYFARFPGRYATNDEALLDEDGHLWVLGRSDDVINVAAHRISTMEIEATIGAQPGVAEVAVVGVPDETKGTVPVAFVVLRPDADAEAVRAAADAAVTSEIGAYARLGNVYVCRALPKTRTGKTMRRVLREIGSTGDYTGDTSAMEDPEAVDAVRAATRG